MKSFINKLLNKLILKLSLITCLILSITTSCSEEEFLDVVPVDRLDKTTFFSTDVEVITAVNGVYATQRSVYGNFSVFVIQEARADNVAQNQNDQPERVSIDIFEEQAGNLLVLNAWTTMYNMINLANAVTDRSGDATGDQELINRAVAEAKFLRALTYFQMVNIWGDLPLRITETRNFNDATVPRSSAETVYNQIVDDLNDAIAGLPENYDGSRHYEVGRATRYAALTLLGKVELQRGNNGAAESALRQVFGQYTLLDNFNEIHEAGNENTAESIFEVNFNPANQTGLGLPGAFIPQREATRLGIAAGGVGGPLPVFPTQDLIEAFEPDDERKDATLTIAETEGIPYISKFMDLGAVAQGHNVNLVVLRYADVLLMLAEAIGESTEAYGYINQVRERAGLGSIDSNSPGTFAEKLLHERRLEFAFEQHRWFDLLRIAGQDALNIMEAQLQQQEGRPFNLNQNKLLFPIPTTEIDVSNGVVTQNAGY